MELGVIIGKTCSHVHKYDVHDYIAGYCLALDLTEVKHLVRVDEEKEVLLVQQVDCKKSLVGAVAGYAK